MDIGDDQPILDAVKCKRALHLCVDTSFASFHDLVLVHRCYSTEQMDIVRIPLVTISVDRVFFYDPQNVVQVHAFGMWHDVKSVVEERSVNDIACSIVLSS